MIYLFDYINATGWFLSRRKSNLYKQNHDTWLRSRGYSGKIFVHRIIEHFKVNLVVLVDPVELLPGQLRDEVLPDGLIRA